MAHQDSNNRDKVATLCETRAGRSSDVPVRPRGGEWSVANGWQRSPLVLMREPEGEKKKKKKKWERSVRGVHRIFAIFVPFRSPSSRTFKGNAGSYCSSSPRFATLGTRFSSGLSPLFSLFRQRWPGGWWSNEYQGTSYPFYRCPPSSVSSLTSFVKMYTRGWV